MELKTIQSSTTIGDYTARLQFLPSRRIVPQETDKSRIGPKNQIYDCVFWCDIVELGGVFVAGDFCRGNELDLHL